MKKIIINALIALITLGTFNNAWGVIRNFKDIEDVPVYRFRIEFRTDTKRYADTDDPVYIKVSTANNTKYYLDHGGNDFEKGDYNYFNVMVKDVPTVKQINKLVIGKQGNDGWCLKWFKIYINSSSNPLYRKSYSTCKWIDGNDGHSPWIYFSGTTLRKYSGWNLANKGRVPRVNEIGFTADIIGSFRLSDLAFESMIETSIGDMISPKRSGNASNLYWGGKHGTKWVASHHPSGKNRRYIHFDLDLKYDVSWLPDPEIDVDFNLKFKCNSKGEITIKSYEPVIDVDFHWIWDILTFGVFPLIAEYYIQPRATAAFGSLSNSNLEKGFSMIPAGYSFVGGSCPSIYVYNSGEVKFDWN